MKTHADIYCSIVCNCNILDTIWMPVHRKVIKLVYLYSGVIEVYFKNRIIFINLSGVFSRNQFSSVTQSYLTLCNFIDCSMPGFLVLHQVPELAQTHVHRVGDVIQPYHPLSTPSLPAFNLSQHQGLFQWVSSLQFFPKYKVNIK